MRSSDWIETTLEHIAKPDYGLVDGPFGSSLPASDYTIAGIPVIRGSNLSIGDFRFIDTEFVYVSEATAKRLNRSLAFPNDIIFTKKGTLGQTGFVPSKHLFQKFLISSNQMKLSVDETKADPLFVYYFVSSPASQQKIIQDSSITGVPKTNLAYLRKFPIHLPPLSEQRAIAAILGSLDDKIELNRQMNRTLEAMAQALFKSWFVDFDPVRAKAEGRETGLPEDVAALFPDRLVESELGEIPEGWVSGTLANFAELNVENWSKSAAPEQIDYVDLSNTKWGKIESTTSYIWDEAPSRAQRVLRCGDTIVGTVRPGNGSYALITENGLTGSTGFAVLRPRRSEFQEFVYLAATDQKNIDRLAHLADGGAYPAVRPEVVIATDAVQPNGLIAQNFSQITKPIMSKIAANEKESRTVAALRDTLLPKLISGEVRIKTTEVI